MYTVYLYTGFLKEENTENAAFLHIVIIHTPLIIGPVQSSAPSCAIRKQNKLLETTPKEVAKTQQIWANVQKDLFLFFSVWQSCSVNRAHHVRDHKSFFFSFFKKNWNTLNLNSVLKIFRKPCFPSSRSISYSKNRIVSCARLLSYIWLRFFFSCCFFFKSFFGSVNVLFLYFSYISSFSCFVYCFFFNSLRNPPSHTHLFISNLTSRLVLFYFFVLLL